MVVLIIMGISSSVFFITITKMGLGDHISRGTQLVFNDLLSMRMRAVSIKSKHRLRFTSTTEWRMEEYIGGSPPTDWQLVGSVKHMPRDTYISMTSLSNAGSNLEALSNGLFSFLNGMSGDPYISVEGLGSIRIKSIQVFTGGAVRIVTHENTE